MVEVDENLKRILGRMWSLTLLLVMLLPLIVCCSILTPDEDVRWCRVDLESKMFSLDEA